MKYANLHMHSTYSDASMTPCHLVRIGKSLGYHAMALTDHETDAGVKEFMTYAKQEGIDAISGVEFFAVDEGLITKLSLHIVALDYDMENPGIRALIKDRVDLNVERTRNIFELVVSKGAITDLTWNDVVDYNPPGAWLCIDSIFNAMELKHHVVLSKSKTDSIRNVFKSPEAQVFNNPHRHASDIIKTIRNAEGIAVLAHPNDQMHMVEKLVSYGLNGIEVSHPRVYNHIPYQTAEAAMTYNLYRSGGTDHTGPMSGNGGDRAIPVFNGITEEEFTAIRERRLDYLYK